MTAGPFKERYNNHKKSVTNAKYAEETELLKYTPETGKRTVDNLASNGLLSNVFLHTLPAEDHATYAWIMTTRIRTNKHLDSFVFAVGLNKRLALVVDTVCFV